MEYPNSLPQFPIVGQSGVSGVFANGNQAAGNIPVYVSMHVLMLPRTNLFIYFLLFLMFIFETETEHEWERVESEGDTESRAGSRLRAVRTEPNAGLKRTNREIMT